jgi:hypothetical protein
MAWFLILPCQLFGSTIEIPLIDSLYITDSDKSVTGDGITFDIDKRAVIQIKLPQLAEISFDYRAEGYFRLQYTTITHGRYLIVPHLLMVRKLQKGSGRLNLNLRHTVNWSAESYPLLIIEGTGRFFIKNLKGTTVSSIDAYEKEKNRAFFWRPEVERVTTINFLTPVYWDFSKQIYWPAVLGGLLVATLSAVAIYAKYRRFKVAAYISTISILFIFVYSVHFAVRFLPLVNNGVLLENSEKVKNFYFRPEFGQLASAARELVKPTDRVAFMGEKGDWLSPEAFCFNIAPVKCSFLQTDNVTYKGLDGSPGPSPENAGLIAFYNSDLQLPAGFEKKFKLNKNVFIAVRE